MDNRKRKDRCAENETREKDAKVPFGYINSSGEAQQTNVSDHRRPFLYMIYCTNVLKISLYVKLLKLFYVSIKVNCIGKLN